HSLDVALDNPTPQEGDTLTAMPVIGNSSDAGATVHYQWQVADTSSWTNVGSDQANYTAAEADETHAIRVLASFTASTGQLVNATSDPTAAVADITPTLTSPLISGAAQEGQILTATAAVANDADA